MAMAGGVPGRREESGGSDWGGMERRGGVPVEAAGESRTDVAARRGGGAGVEAEAEAAVVHQDGSGGGGQASRRRRRGGERSRRRGGGGGRPGGGGGRSSEVAMADDRGRREGWQWKEQVRKKETGQELIYPKGLRYRLVSPTGA